MTALLKSLAPPIDRGPRQGTKQKYNNTLAPYQTCEKAGSKYDRGTYFVVKWAEIYLAAARARLAPLIQGYDLKTVDLYAMQQTCAYEVGFWCMVTERVTVDEALRPLQSGTRSSANCLRRRNGKVSTTRSSSLARLLRTHR